MSVLFSKACAKCVEIVNLHPFEEVRKYLLLYLPVREKMKFHQYEKGRKEQKTTEHLSASFCKADKLKESVLGSQCAIKVESIYLSHVLLDILKYVDNEEECQTEG